MKNYAAVVEREADGRCAVYVPDLPGCASMGDTRRQALANVRESLRNEGQCPSATTKSFLKA